MSSGEMSTKNRKMDLKDDNERRIRRIFGGMKFRCYSDKCVGYMADCYKNRGIKICDEWLNDVDKFYEWSIANGYDSTKTIDRINTNGNYEPSNCRWVNMKTQQNNKRNNVVVKHNGESHTFSEWCDILGISERSVNHRIRKERWTLERALFTPLTDNKEFINNGKMGSWEEKFNKWVEKSHRSVRCLCEEKGIDKIYYTIADASRDLGISHCRIINNARGRTKRCRIDGVYYKFEYVDEQDGKS